MPQDAEEEYFNGLLGRTAIAAFVAYVGLILLLRISGKRTLASVQLQRES